MKTSLFVGAFALLLLSSAYGAHAYFLPTDNPHAAGGLANARSHKPVCQPGHAADDAVCHSHVVTNEKGAPMVTPGPVGYGPTQFRTAYNLLGQTGSPTQVIAIVDAYDHPSIQSDLDAYSAVFGIATLPSCVGAVASSPVACFQKVDQRGGAAYPATDAGWALEIALDVESAHAVCPGCSILLVEGDSSMFANLMTAVDKAVSLGAKEISNSYGSSGEFSGENSYDFHFNHPGIAITVSSGDAGYGTSYPAVSPFVTAVGGTSLFLNTDNTYNRESAWSGSGSGCSLIEFTKPSGQPTVGGCSRRIIADVAADADPSTGAAVYDSVPYNGQTGWFQVGGTSLSSPIIAAVYALAGGVPSGVQGNSLPYSLKNYSSNMHDITTGSNGTCRRKTALCTAISGFDGPTGLGSPNGFAAF